MALAVGIAGLTLAVSFGQAPEPTPVVSEKPMTADQLAIYRIVLSGWMDNGKGKHAVHLAIQTSPFSLSDTDADCGKSLGFVAGSKGEVHRFRKEDLALLKPSKVELVDPDAQSKEVAENDPGKHIGPGNSIASAVANGFAHGLTRLSEIRFDKDQTHAILWYDFSCGGTCGNGATVLMEKKNGVWGIMRHCSTSIAGLGREFKVAGGI
jgi:hypothetical protein